MSKYWSWGKNSSGKNKNVDDYDDYDYGYSRRGSTTRRTSYSDWNWGTWGTTNTVEDDDEDIFIKSHPNYFTPSQQDISWKIADYKDDEFE